MLKRLLLPALLFAGCGEIAPPAQLQVADDVPAVPAEASWDEQIAGVRAGTVDAVRISQTPLTAAQWAMLAQGCDHLRIIEADVHQLAADDLAVLKTLPRLERLKLIGPVNDADLVPISFLVHLKILNLPEGRFTDEGMSSVGKLQELELLRFGSPRVTDDGLAVVATLPALRFLHLLDVPITDAGLEHLHSMQRLESFYLDGGRCTDEGLYALLQALPKLHFHRDQLHLPDDPHAHPHR